ncbi:MAG: FIST C-terminal domain-containing protein [Candidatus Krumholzibacteria bacterium]|nr:FIST C-terminal domain-containing protein [Candidatus Krumholzibacteria bacterium]
MPDPMRFASATSTEAELLTAIPDLASKIRRQGLADAIDFALIFLSSHFGDEVEAFARAINDELKPRMLVGCTGEGVIGSNEEIERTPAITLVAARLPNAVVEPLVFRAPQLHKMLGGSVSLFDSCKPPDSTRMFLMIADPFTTPMDDLLGAFNTAFPGTPIIGGMASGAPAPGKSALIVGNEVVRDGAIAVAFAGELDVDIIVSQGCRPIGPVFRVTNAKDNVIADLEGETPLDCLQELLSEMSGEERELLRNGLFVGRAIDSKKELLGRGDFLIRGVMGIDQDSGAITVGDYIDEGEVVQFHVRDALTAKEDLEMMLTPHALFGQPSGAFLFSCNGRGTRLYDYANGDISAIRQFFPGINLAGFFCAGEIGPIGGKNFLHGHTASLALIRPSSTAIPKQP